MNGEQEQENMALNEGSGGQCPMHLPEAEAQTGLAALKELVHHRSLLGPLVVMHEQVGDIFKITLPRFQPAVAVGPDANRQLLIDDRDKFNWRTESDPVTKLLRNGVLVTDGALHDGLRAIMDPTMYRKQAIKQLIQMEDAVRTVAAKWVNGEIVDMLVEMRRIALLILIGSLFKVDFKPDMERLWQPILDIIKYISPGFWILWPNMPRPQYRRVKAELDDYLYQIIKLRRSELAETGTRAAEDDLLGKLIENKEMDDDLIRDQLLTMLIAGHDTSTALLAWALYLLGSHPEAMKQAQGEVDAVFKESSTVSSYNSLKQLTYLDSVIKETLRLYPPIHLGNRQANTDVDLQGYHVAEGSRVMYSIYLAHRDPKYWSQPNEFVPERFDRNQKQEQPPLTYLPFGGGPRNCIGAAFAQVEAKLILAHLLQQFDLTLVNKDVTTHMGATLEPRPGVMMRVQKRS